jgi:hypothetical protein
MSVILYYVGAGLITLATLNLVMSYRGVEKKLTGHEG